MNIVHEILEKMKISKPQKKFMKTLISTMLSMVGHVNFRNMARFASVHEKTFFRNFSKKFDFLGFNLVATNRVLDQEKCLVLAFDPFFVKKSGKETYGKGTFWNGSHSRAERGLEACGFALVDVDENTAYPLSALQTPSKKDIACLVGKSDANRMDFYTHILQEQLPRVAQVYKTRNLVCDAFFAKEKFVTGIKSFGYHVISRLRSDANLRELAIKQKKGRGRPRKYGKKVNVKDISSFDFSEKINNNISLYTADFFSMGLKRVVRVVCVQNNKSTRLLFSTDRTLRPRDIYNFYKSRFQIEFVFRDAKQFTGLTDCQARSKEKNNFHFNAAMSSLTIAKVREVEARKNHFQKMPFSMASIKRKKYNEILVKRIFSMLGFDPSLKKYASKFKDVIEFGVIRC